MKQKEIKNETDIEMFARIMVSRFDKIDEQFVLVRQEIDEMNHGVTLLGSEGNETNRRLDAIERGQTGLLESADQSVHRNEFNRLEKRVTALEA